MLFRNPYNKIENPMFKLSLDKEAMRKKSGIYKITLRGTNRHYIGQSMDIWKRARMHCNDVTGGFRENYLLHRAIKKYGSEAFDHSVLVFCEAGQLNALELHFMHEFSCFAPNGFNVATMPGKSSYGTKTPDHVKAKISAFHKGKKFTEEHKRKIGDANRGRKHSEESRAKMSAGQTGIKRSEEWKAKLSERMTGKPMSDRSLELHLARVETMKRPVVQLDKDTLEVIASHSSVAEAGRFIGKKASNLFGCCNKTLKTAYGFVWRYADEFNLARN